MKHITALALVTCLLAPAFISDAQAQRMRDFSMPEGESLQQGTTRSNKTIVQPGMNQNNYNNNYNRGSGYNNAQLPGQPSSQFMVGYCDPNFQPVLANTGRIGNLNNCMENQKKEACDMFAGLPRDVQRIMDSVISCEYNNTNGGQMDENGYINQAPQQNDCSQGDSARMNMLRQYWNNQNLAYAIVFLPDMVASGASRCMGGN
jgi:hypothetical protein